MCKFGEEQPSHDYSAHHRNCGENGSQVKLVGALCDIRVASAD